MSSGDHERADYLQTVLALEGLPQEHHDPNNPTPMWRAGAVVNHRLLELAKRDGFDWTQHLGAFTHPVLFLRGDLNDVCTLDQQQELASSYPNATIHTMLSAGHEMIWERPDEYLADVRAYLQQIGMPGVAR
jgi:pimeloyl-ACP methyl ester carboxylesterase